jgi:hypothetical protein
MKRLSDMYKQGDACPLCGAGLLSEVVQSRAMDNLLRILDRFPESLGVLPGVPRPQAVVSRKGKRVEAGLVCEDGEGYVGKG